MNQPKKMKQVKMVAVSITQCKKGLINCHFSAIISTATFVNRTERDRV